MDKATKNLDENMLAVALGFPVEEMTAISIKKRMRALINKSPVKPYKLSREKWLVSPESVPTIREVLWQSNSPKEKAPPTGRSGGKSRAKKSLNLQEYLTPTENVRH